MRENYGDYISPKLLAKWIDDPLNAPGKLTSSPWPDRIRILDVEKNSNDAYEVKGEIIEITSVGKTRGDVAAKRPITLVVRKIGNRWLIDAAALGVYETANSIVYTNTQYGFSFTLPKSWKGFSIVTGKWEGRAIEGPRSGEVVETGPIISIRHPRWTPEKPRQDIPVMIFTLDQWTSLEREEISVGAAPIPPKELGRNNRYVFALPARYNFAFPLGYEEVEEILEGRPLQPLRANE